MSKPSLNSRAPRRGQALILAVLVMLFAVLLSSAFLVVIGNTGRQIGRETDRAEASRNADKAVSFVVVRLRSGDVPSPYPSATPLPPNPDTWNPQADRVLVGDVAGVPTPNNADYDLYYSALDKAMGWASDGYVKYPDPRTSRQAPQFLVASRLLGTSVADDAEGGDKRFMLKITVIGLSSKNPETWSRRTLYKTTNWNGATFSYANFVTSFDPDTQKPISSTLASSVNTAPALNSDLVLPIYAAKGQGNERVTYSPRIAEVGNTLMVSDGQNQPLVGVVKSATLSNSIYSVTVRVVQADSTTATTPPMFAPNAKVALVGSLFENTAEIDDNGDENSLTPTTAPVPTNPQGVVGIRTDVRTAMGPPLTEYGPLGNGSQYNQGLSAPLTTTLVARAPEQRNATFAGQNALSSTGPVAIGNPTPTPGAVGATSIPPQTINFVGVTSETPAPISQFTPNLNQFLRASYDGNGVPRVDTADSLVAPVIAPRSIRPAPIDFASYMNKAKAVGLYISNPDDVEKFNGQPLSTSQLQRLWQRKSFRVGTGGNVRVFPSAAPTPAPTDPVLAGVENARLCYGRPGTDAYIYPMPSGSLEQRGIRGWISPWEFLPRGAQVILDSTTITVILDPLTDGSTNSNLWKDNVGVDTRCARLQIDTATGVRSIGIQGQPPISTTTSPFNGILGAAGNVRVHSLTAWTGAPLSIISGNNIYIEGAVQAPTGMVALLAKKNVVLNPTQFVARPDGTVDTSVGKSAFPGSVSGGTGTVTLTNVSDANSFKLGDKVAVFAPNTKADGWHTVTAINGAVLTFADATIPDAAAVKIKLACDPPIVLVAKANRTVGGAVNPIPANEQFVPTTPGGTEEANIEEYTPTTLPTGTVATDVSWAYKFSVGGDTLARDVPFTNPDGTATNVGIVFDQAAQKKNILFSVQGGDDRNGTPPIHDDGNRSLKIRDTAYKLTISPQPGTATDPPPTPNEQTFDLEMLTGSPDDSQSTLSRLKTSIDTPPAADTDDKANRWRLLLPLPVSPSPTGVSDKVAARRFAKVSMTATLGPDPSDEGETERAKFRVPLTSSVLLFNGTLGPASPTATTSNPLLTIGSFFDFQNGTLPTTPAALTEDARFIDATQAFYGSKPSWSLPPGSTTYPQVASTPIPGSLVKPVSFTRDGAGDYDDQLPTYYISAMHFQRVDSANTSVPAANNLPKTNMNVEVDATIYAEGGSWFVIPVPTPNANNAPSTDTNQQIEWRRPAYAVTINGNIAQMMTPTATIDYDDEPDPDGVAMGAMKRWTDSLSYQVYNGTNPPLWQTIRYQAAPLPAFRSDAMGNVVLDANGNPVPAPISQLPASNDILYTYSN